MKTRQIFLWAHVALFFVLAVLDAKADVPISQLPAGTTLTGTEAIPAVQSGTTVKTTPSAINTYVQGQTTSTTIVNKFTGCTGGDKYLGNDGACHTVPTGTGTVTSVGVTVPSGLTVTGSPVTTSGTIDIGGVLNPVAGGTGAATLSGVLKGNGTSAIGSAASSDVIALWSGTCDVSSFLRGDGTCATVSSGSVTSVALTVPSGFSVTGSPITSSGTLAISGVLDPVAGGTGNSFFAVSGPASTTKTFTFPNASATVLTTNAAVTVPQGGTGAATLSGVLKGNGTSAIGSAASSDVISLWSGTCNSSSYLRGDGSCSSVSASPAGANTQIQFNNSGSFGATSDFVWVDGSDTLRIFSDGVKYAEFSPGGIEFGSGFGVAFTQRGLAHFYQHTHIYAPNGELFFTDLSRPAGNQEWGMSHSGGEWRLHTNADNGGSPVADAINITRSGTAVSSIKFGNATNNNTVSFLGTGLVTFGGATTHTGAATFNAAGNQFNGVTTFTDDMKVSASFYRDSPVSPSALASGNTNNYNPSGLVGQKSVARLTPNASGSTLTGLQSATSGTIITLNNIGTSGSITLAHENSGSTASNRFICPGSSDYVVQPGGSVTVWYDGASSRWRVQDVQQASGGGTASSTTYTNTASNYAATNVQAALDEIERVTEKYLIHSALASQNDTCAGITSGYSCSGTFVSEVGTRTPQGPASTSFLTTFSRARLTTAASINSNAGVYGKNDTENKFFQSISADVNGGGYRLVYTFGFDTIRSDSRALIGIIPSSSSPPAGTSDPSSLTNIVALGKDEADANLQIMHNDASGVATKVSTGISATGVQGKLLRLTLVSLPPGTSILAKLEVLDTGGSSFSTTLNTNLPAADTALTYGALVNTGGTTGTAVNIDFISLKYSLPLP